jgi:hypothetical protein
MLTLARALEVPFRDRNSMLTAAGYAPVYRETSLGLGDLRARLFSTVTTLGTAQDITFQELRGEESETSRPANSS